MALLPPKKRRELGDFLRAHRARLTPASLGLPAIGRRRTPGLRREEVAQACGMSATWYTWLEQGRDIAASPPRLSALARALQLTPAERAYLFELADRRDPSLPGTALDDGMDVPPALARAIAAIDGPAYLLNSLWNARAWNRPAAGLFVGWLDGANDRNLLRYVFLSPVAARSSPTGRCARVACWPSSVPIPAAISRMSPCRHWSTTCAAQRALRAMLDPSMPSSIAPVANASSTIHAKAA